MLMSLIDFTDKRDLICIQSNDHKHFYFYKDILIDFSVVFSAMLNSSMIEKNNIINIDRSSDVINLFLNKLVCNNYEGLTLGNVFDLYDMANCYQIHKTKNLVENYLILSAENICTNIPCINNIVFYNMAPVINRIIKENSYGMRNKINIILSSIGDCTPEVIKSGILCNYDLQYHIQIINEYINIHPEFKDEVKELVAPSLSQTTRYLNFETLQELIKLLKLVSDLDFFNEILTNILLNSYKDNSYTISNFKH